MPLTTFVLRLKAADGTYAVAALDLPTGTTLEEATEIAVDNLEPGLRLERITDSDTKESATLQSVIRAPQGFGK